MKKTKESVTCDLTINVVVANSDHNYDSCLCVAKSGSDALHFDRTCGKS